MVPRLKYAIYRKWHHEVVQTVMDGYIYGRDHLSGDTKWRYAEIWGIVIFPKMQQLSLLVISNFSGSLLCGMNN